VIDWEYQGLWSTHGIDATKDVYVQEGRLKVETVSPSPRVMFVVALRLLA
jgi:hypothetical protein